MKNTKKINSFFKALISGIGIFVLIFVFLQSFLVWLDLELRYWIKKIYSKNIISKDIILVEIDEKTTNKLWWPFNRENYIKTIENLKKSWAKIIALDVLFADKWNDKKIDEKLSKAFKKSWNIILWWKIEKNWSFTLPIFLDENFSKNKNIDYYQNSVKKIWYYNPNINPYNWKIYSLISETKNKRWEKIEHFSFIIAKDYLEKNNIININKNRFWKEFFINYENPRLFKKESFINIYNGKFKKEDFKNKLVIIWYTAEWALDKYSIPEFWEVKWVYVIINTINNILTKTYIKFFNPIYEKILIFLLIFLIIYTNLKFIKLSQLKWFIFGTLSVLILLFIIYITIYYYYLETKNIYLLMIFPSEFIFAVFFAFFASIIFKYITEDKNKKLLNKALWEYISKDVAEEILHWDWKINLDWEKKNISILFSDIEGFTSISEKMEAKKLVSFLQKYLWNMSEIIMENKGFIDKYEWDAIMALWWIFWETYKTKTYDILYSALKQQEKLKILNKNFKIELWQEIKVRIWIHCWEAIVWNIWAIWKKMEFTALWDNVNLASRLGWVNKFYSTYICCSEDIYLKEKENFDFRFLDNIKVKWKNNWIKIFELLSEKWKITEIQEKIKNIFEEAIKFYFEKDFEKAIELFKKSEKLSDKTSTIFILRCKYFIKNPPKDNWDWIWEMKEK